MEKSIQEIAVIIKGQVENDNPALKITGVNGLVEAGEQDISFAIPPYVSECHRSRAGAMILAFGERQLSDRPVIRVADPKVAFATLLEVFRPEQDIERIIDKNAFVAPSAKIGKNVAVGAFAYIAENAEIGDNSIIYPHVYIGKDVIGNTKLADQEVYVAIRPEGFIIDDKGKFECDFDRLEVMVIKLFCRQER